MKPRSVFGAICGGLYADAETRLWSAAARCRFPIESPESGGKPPHSKLGTKRAGCTAREKQANQDMVVGDTPYDILATHRIALPIVAVRCGGFDPSLLRKAEFIFDDTNELTRRLDEIDQYFRSG